MWKGGLFLLTIKEPEGLHLSRMLHTAGGLSLTDADLPVRKPPGGISRMKSETNRACFAYAKGVYWIIYLRQRLYHNFVGGFYTIISEGKFTQPFFQKMFDKPGKIVYIMIRAQHKTSYMREWLSWWSTTLPRSGSRVRVPSRAIFKPLMDSRAIFLPWNRAEKLILVFFMKEKCYNG